MTDIETDILISGGGVAGLTAAAAFASAGFRVVCVDPAAPITEEETDGADLRTTAFLQPAKSLLLRAGIWQYLEPHAAPLQVMRIVDAGGQQSAARDIADFNATDISSEPFGWNFPNWLLRREMLKRLDALDNATFLPGTATDRVTTREAQARVTLTDGRTVACRLLIAADGRNSNIRSQLGIRVETWRYGQKALAFSVTHTVPHNNVSTEIHRSGGPFTLVPLPDLDGKARSAIVWMETGPNIDRLLKLPVPEFERAINERSAGLFGRLALVGRRTVWPIITQHAERLSGQRTALIAEAAHVVPPIGAQGLNMSLNDITALLDLAEAHPERLGDARMLDAYHRARWLDISARVRGIDMLNRTSMAGNPLLRDLRRWGLKTIHTVRPLRIALMQAGLGARSTR